MQDEILKNVRNSIRHWYLPLILGIILIVVGIFVFRTPLESYITLALLFSVTFLVTGVIEIAYAISNRKFSDTWGWSLAGGIIDFLLGIVLVSNPQIPIAILPLFVGFAILFRSTLVIAWSIELSRQKIEGWGNLTALGILGLLFSFILLWNPLFAGLTIVFYTGLAFIMAGIFQIYLAFRLKKLNKLVK